MVDKANRDLDLMTDRMLPPSGVYLFVGFPGARVACCVGGSFFVVVVDVARGEIGGVLGPAVCRPGSNDAESKVGDDEMRTRLCNDRQSA